MAPNKVEDSLDYLLSDLITAFHILHQHGVFDEHGQISVRNPQDPTTFFTSNTPAILVASKNDLSQWHVSDSSPVAKPYSGCEKNEEISPNTELFAHSSMYHMYPGVQSIIHAHCLSTIAYGLCNSWGSMLQPSYLMAGFIGPSPPIFDIATCYDNLPDSHPKNLLINTAYIGDELASTFRKSPDDDMEMNGAPTDLPEQKVVFMRGHGYTTWAENIMDAVWRALHIRRDADIQTAAMAQRDATELEVVYLSEQEAKDCEKTTNFADKKQWMAWTAQADRCGMYRNNMRSLSHAA
ncbi:hypothetical protein LTR99_007034 [Exophiala xenobiotica]|uniref:Class II aldolase/adducin N-terminal domain-containing protein n=1 Tax=Vermiconidia calcicola TaxID=1690605 RepID=A0AAV9PSL1_9PEZI|nr:hypothetical protein LTR92_006852 [Exophiala xenobiotica]KAK5528828.1 hypothetical protein LTR25_010011 [Vermiconidia calcicola]KAK5539442.1 hypothetical protein LTR23_006462 [Chaetothyriales sp. CCFEE 6169]KAK5208930.1 hypothetical protein LTR41_005327 [Exophiala xenobiotica]KAK5221142.1 hypothetical protein LTR72_006702 [Exophiala xenobiotica]